MVSGVGAAGSAIIQLLKAQGARHIVAAGRSGAIHSGEEYDDEHRSWIAANTNEEGFSGTLHEALKGADVFIGVSAPHVIGEEQVASMADDAIVFAMANPTPEIDPAIASRHAAVVATGRSDFPNQINNVLAFPGFFRGLLDAGASDITPEMLVAAAEAIANRVADDELNASYIIPSVFDPQVAADVASCRGTPQAAATQQRRSAHGHALRRRPPHRLIRSQEKDQKWLSPSQTPGRSNVRRKFLPPRHWPSSKNSTSASPAPAPSCSPPASSSASRSPIPASWISCRKPRTCATATGKLHLRRQLCRTAGSK